MGPSRRSGSTAMWCVQAFVLAALWMSSGVSAQGSWQTVVQDAGISTMHCAVTHYGNVVLLDRTNIGNSELPLPAGHVCRKNPLDRVNTDDCTAHSAIYSPSNNGIRALFIFTDTWCSSGQFNGNGELVQTGGDSDGVSKIRDFTPCPDNGLCDWIETTTPLQAGRWYASNQQLPDGTQIVVGGRATPTVEYVPANGRGQFNLELLVQTNDAQNDNLYPYVHLLPNNNLFIFANQDSIQYNWQTNVVVSKYPTLAGGPRNYPSAGSSVLLPLNSPYTDAQIVVCGGAAAGAFSNPNAQYGASNSCGRIDALAANPAWATENMPIPRTMGDMIITPDGNVIIINGAQKGSQGWGFASDPAYNPVLYYPNAALGSRFETLAATTIPRVYHSVATLLGDGRILVAGSNTHQFYTFTGVFPTELRIEAYSPPYLGGTRPGLTAPGNLAYGKAFTATVTYTGTVNGNIAINLRSSPFTTHSFSMGQRLLQLPVGAPVAAGAGKYTVGTTAPPSSTIAPGGYYFVFAVVNGSPSVASWTQI